jgi:hypothetical protein
MSTPGETPFQIYKRYERKAWEQGMPCLKPHKPLIEEMLSELTAENATLKAEVAELEKYAAEDMEERNAELEAKLKVADLALCSIEASTLLKQARRRARKALAELSRLEQGDK